MKKFTKITLIIAAVLAVIGFGFIIAGSVTAGGAGVLAAQLRSGELNFGNWHFEDGVYYKGGVEVDVTDVVNDAMNLLPVGTEKAENEFTENITSLKVDVDLANITIKSADVNQIRATLKEGYTRYYETKVDGETLHISYDVGGHSFKQGPKIVVEIPKEMALDGIYIDADLGEIILSDLTQSIEELEINSDLGNVRIENCKIEADATATAALGNIIIDDSYFRRIDMSADMGNIEFSGSIEYEIVAQADMGNIEAEVSGIPEDYNIQLSADMGSVELEGQKRGNSFEEYHTSAQKNIVLNCDMGNVELEFE